MIITTCIASGGGAPAFPPCLLSFCPAPPIPTYVNDNAPTQHENQVMLAFHGRATPTHLLLVDLDEYLATPSPPPPLATTPTIAAAGTAVIISSSAAVSAATPPSALRALLAPGGCLHGLSVARLLRRDVYMADSLAANASEVQAWDQLQGVAALERYGHVSDYEDR